MNLETSRCSGNEKTCLEKLCEFLVTQRGWVMAYNSESFAEIRKGMICLNISYANIDGSTIIMLMNLKTNFGSQLNPVLDYLLNVGKLPDYPIEPLIDEFIKHIEETEIFFDTGIYMDKNAEDFQLKLGNKEPFIPSPWW